MCGISGQLWFGGRMADTALAAAMNARLAHRGPDGGALHIAGPVALGHRRLAIIDPKSGQQPLYNEDRTIVAIVNGEIYNFQELRRQLIELGHRFQTAGDCETIVHGYEQWGPSVVERLRGMFAFALWDNRAGRLLLARDRFGIKPLCYTLNDQRLLFASELQALTAAPDFDKHIDLDALDAYLHLQYIPAPKTIYANARKIEPGHLMEADASGRISTPRRWWSLRWQPDRHRSEAEWAEAVDAALRDAVGSHLVADVPFGAFLSGGVDSSAVVAYAAQALPEPLTTFTIGFDLPALDERAEARRFADRLRTRHREQLVGIDALSLLPSIARHYGEPFADSSAVCTWRVCAQARREVPMVLSGDGGDEVFAGYGYFPKLVETYPQRSGWQQFRQKVGNLLRAVGAIEAAPSLIDAWYGRSPFFGEAERRRLWRPEHQERTEATCIWNAQQFASSIGLHTLSRTQDVDIKTYLPNNNLAKVDIASMANGLEVRVPLLDHLLVETIASMPVDQRLRRTASGWCTKFALKSAASRFYPWEWLNTPKRGFSVPVGQWMNQMGGELRARLTDRQGPVYQYFDPGAVTRLLDEHAAGLDHGHRLWSLLVLDEWHQQFSMPGNGL